MASNSKNGKSKTTNRERAGKNQTSDGRGKMLDPTTDGRRNRGPREFSSEFRATFMAKKGADTEPAREGQLTNYGLLKKIWSGRGEIVANVKGVPVEVKRSDLIRQLEALPREGKAVFDVRDGDGDLEGLRVLV